jgi:hypothetical protein
MAVVYFLNEDYLNSLKHKFLIAQLCAIKVKKKRNT